MRERTVLLGMMITLGSVIWVSETFARGSALLIALMLLAMGHGFYMAASQYRLRHRPDPQAPSYRPFVSIVVPAKNERTVIEGTLRNLLAIEYLGLQGQPGYEVLAIDDGSTDGTGELLEELALQLGDRLRIHHRHGGYPSKAGVLNEATPITHGDILCIIDADARVDSDFLDRIVPYLADTKVGAVQAAKHISNSQECWLTQAQADELAGDRVVQKGRDLADGAVELRGNGMLLKRQALEDAGGWTQDALTEDLDMSSKLAVHGWEIRFAYPVRIYEEAIPTMQALIRQRRRWAEGALRRHIEYFYILGMPTISLNKKIDMGVYFVQLAFPIWLIEDLAYQAWEIAHGQPLHLTVVLYVLLGSGILMGLHLFNALRTEQGFRRPFYVLSRTLKTLTYLYHWIPVFMYVIGKVMLKTAPGKWGKTVHRGPTSPRSAQSSVPAEPGISAPTTTAGR